MKTDLDELIELLEIEELSLNKLIEDSLKERDYLTAHYHSVALNKIKDQLGIFNGFKGDLYNAKLGLEMMMQWMDKTYMDNTYKDAKFKEYFEASKK